MTCTLRTKHQILHNAETFMFHLSFQSFQSLVYRTNAHDVIGDAHLEDCTLDYTPSCNSEKLLGK